MSQNDDVHYTAVLEITKVVNSSPAALTSSRSATPERPERRTTEVARIIVRSDTIEKLVDKMTAHLNLVED